MCHSSVLAWGQTVLTAEAVQGRRVLEVGSRNVNGSLRPHVEALGPAVYLGVDMEPGEGVDEICYAESLFGRFGPDAWDVVLSTEMLEHCRNWRAAVHNMKGVLRPGGLLLLTTRSVGFPLHEYPGDYWRFELADMEAIFADFPIKSLEPDREAPGVFLLAQKRSLSPMQRADLSRIRLYSMQAGARVL